MLSLLMYKGLTMAQSSGGILVLHSEKIFYLFLYSSDLWEFQNSNYFIWSSKNTHKEKGYSPELLLLRN